MPEVITISSVREMTGFDSSEVSDDDVSAAIDDAEDQLPRFLNTRIIPREVTRFRTGDDTRRLMLNKTPLLALRELKIDGTKITIDGNVIIDRNTGRIELDKEDGDPEESYFSRKENSIAIRYLYGLRERGDTSTKTDSENTTGESVVLSVDDESSFSVGDWVEIYGMDGNQEAAKIESTSTGQITVDELRQTHDSGSQVTKLIVRQVIKRLLKIVASLQVVFQFMGTSYTFNTGYSVSELSVQKGVPYTHWQEVARRWIAERDRILDKIKPQFAIK